MVSCQFGICYDVLMKVFGIAGWSGSGKTTLIVRLLAELRGRGLSVSTIKHTHHLFQIDASDHESRAFRDCGAYEAMVVSPRGWALIHELRDEQEPDLRAMIDTLAEVDLLLVEGFKFHPHDKLEIYRAAVGKPLLCVSDPHVVAVASDGAVPDARVPVFHLDDVAGIADFIRRRTGL